MSDTSIPRTGLEVPPALPGPPPLPSAGDTIGISWSGPTWGLVGLGFINFLLSVVTLGIYHFWGKTEVRRRLAASIRINSEPMEYTGTGLELFLGFIIILVVVLIPFQVLLFGTQIYFGPQSLVTALTPLLLLPGIFYLYGVAAYRARRYRRSRLRWRGVRGALVGNSWTYGLQVLWTTVAGQFTYGWLTPWRDNYLHRRLTNDTRFGDRPLKYTGQAGSLYPSYTIGWVGQLVALLVVFGAAAAVIIPPAIPLFNDFKAITDASDVVKPFDMWLEIWLNPSYAELWHKAYWLVAAGFGFLLLYILIVDLLWNFFYAREYSYFLQNTALEGLRFDLKVSVWGLFWLFFSNTLMSLFTFTILSPVAEARVSKYFVERLSASGSIDFASILQSQERLSKTGEGLAEAFDVEANSYFILSI